MSIALKKTRVDAALLTVTDARRRAVFLSTCVPFFVGRPASRSASWSVWNRRTVLVSLYASLLDGLWTSMRLPRRRFGMFCLSVGRVSVCKDCILAGTGRGPL